MKATTSPANVDEAGKAQPFTGAKEAASPHETEKARLLCDEKAKLEEIFDRIPEQHHATALRLLDAFAEKAPHLPVTPLPTSKEEMKALGIETYVEFKARTGSTNGLECLLHNWGRWLKCDTPTLDRDYMSTKDLRKLDIQLYNRIKKMCSADEYHKYIPSLSMLNKQIYEQMTEETIKETLKNMSIISHQAPAT